MFRTKYPQLAAQVNPAIQNYEVERIERARPTNLTAWEQLFTLSMKGRKLIIKMKI